MLFRSCAESERVTAWPPWLGKEDSKTMTKYHDIDRITIYNKSYNLRGYSIIKLGLRKTGGHIHIVNLLAGNYGTYVLYKKQNNNLVHYVNWQI